MNQQLSNPLAGVMARSPLSMKWALALGAFAMLGLVGLSLYLIFYDLVRMGGYMFGLNLAFGVLYLIPAAALAVPYGFIVAGRSGGRIAYTVVAVLMLAVFIGGLATLGPDKSVAAYPMPMLTAATIAAVLAWLPQSKPYFLRTAPVQDS